MRAWRRILKEFSVRRRAVELIAAFALAMGMLVYLYIHAHSIEAERNTTATLHLLELKQLDATLEEEILRGRYNLTQSYTKLNATLDRQAYLLWELQSPESALSQLQDRRLRTTLDNYIRIQASGAALARRYESTNAILNQLVDRFPEYAEALEKSLRSTGVDEDTISLAQILKDDALLYVVRGGDKLRDEIDGWLTGVDLNLVGLPVESTPAVRNFFAITHGLMIYKADTDTLIRRLFELDSGELIDELHLAYLGASQKANRQAEIYRKLMLIFGSALICCIAYILVRLRHSVAALDAANKRLRMQRLALEKSNHDLGREIDERRRAQMDLIQAKATADYANRAKSEFLAHMSHELRTPLNAIIGFSQIIRDRMMGPDLHRYIDYAKAILQSGEHLLQIINDVLDLSKIEAGKVELEENVFDIRRAIDSCINLVRERATNGGLTLTARLPSALHDLRADERKVKQILINLLSNAVKFTPRGGRVAVRGTLTEDGGLVLIVADTGIGMATDGIAAALEPFSQLDNQLTRRYEGTGLGLPLTRRLVEMHGGKLEIDSEAGRGTRVSVHFPAERVLPAAPALLTGDLVPI